MATFHIHEDAENIVPQQGKGCLVKTAKPLQQQQGPRAILQCLTNGVRATKRFRLDPTEDDDCVQHPTQTVGELVTSLNLECLQLASTENIKCLENDADEDPYLPFDAVTVSEYGPDIWKYLNQMEAKLQWPKFNYMNRQKHITEDMRCILVDWLVSVACEYKMSEQTIHLAVNYIDRFLSYMSVVREKFQLLGAAAMMLAVKVEEVNLLDADEWTYLSGKAYTTHQITRMEQLLLKVLKFDLNSPTMASFIQHLCVMHSLDKKTLYTALYISELILLEGGPYLQYLPSKLAAASIILARYVLYKKNPCFKKLEVSSGYSFKELSPVVVRQHRTFQDSPTKELQSIQSKYKGDRYHKVAAIVPRALYLEECDSN